MATCLLTAAEGLLVSLLSAAFTKHIQCVHMHGQNLGEANVRFAGFLFLFFPDLKAADIRL